MPQVTTDILIHYRVLGAGPPVLWHNGGCGDGRMWELGGYLDALPGYAHVLLDHRGHGLSGSPAGLVGHRMERYVADVLAVLDDLGQERAAFVGYSSGARVGYAVACTRPDRLTGVVGLDSVPDDDETSEEILEFAHEVLRRGTADVLAEIATYEVEPVPAWLIEHLGTTDSLGFAGAVASQASEPSLAAHAPSLRLPFLFLVGVNAEDDQWLSRARDLAGLLPDGRVVALTGAPHLAAFHRTDLTLPPIRDFLEEVSRRT